MSERTYPDASQPMTVAEDVGDTFDLHTKGTGTRGSNGDVEYHVTVWVDAERDARVVATVVSRLEDHGYSITTIKEPDTTGNLAIKAEA